MTFHINETALTFPIKPEQAQELSNAVGSVMKTFAEVGPGSQAGCLILRTSAGRVRATAIWASCRLATCWEAPVQAGAMR